MRRYGRVFWIAGAVLVVILVGLAVLNMSYIYDYFRGLTYAPSSEMLRIRGDLKLNNRGQFVFNAAQPKLSESEEFNAVCRQKQEVEMAVLGCYTGGNIYVYNIMDKELDGIRELTTAHELLHAVWAEMSDSKKQELNSALEKVLADNESLREELAVYGDDEKEEELYVRAGTEVADLPDVLEKHYAEIFENQDLIVGFYNSYIGVFRQIEAEMETLKGEMATISAEVEAKKADYEARAEQLTKDVKSFNECAETVGCFAYEGEFLAQKGILVAEQEALGVLYDEINGLIDEYNVRVEKYNADVRQGEKLQQMINSNSKVQELE